jgi:hypothetical protein
MSASLSATLRRSSAPTLSSLLSMASGVLETLDGSNGTSSA